MDEKAVCWLCDLIWSLTILATCTYLVFWKDHSGAWYILAIMLAGMWRCNRDE